MTKEKNKLLIEIVQNTVSLTKKGVKDWRNAWQMAINKDNPKRKPLYDIYDDVMIDSHLSGCLEQLRGFVLSKSFKLVKVGTNLEDRELTEKFEARWFKNFLLHSLESAVYGFSLIALPQVDPDIFFDNVALIPRRHVIPEYSVIIKETGDDPSKGTRFDDQKLINYLIPVGDPFNLGLLLKVAPHCISKKNMAAFWDTFGEIFGMPVRIGKTLSRDKTEIDKIESMLKDMGSAGWGVFPEGTEIDFKESSRQDSFNVFNARIDRINSEISKCILGQTMTMDNGASKAQGEIHLQVLKNIVEKYADFLRDIVNKELLPRMDALNLPVKDYRFDWDNSIDYSPEQQLQIESTLLQNGYDIDPKYFVDKYNIQITGRTSPVQTLHATSQTLPTDFFV